VMRTRPTAARVFRVRKGPATLHVLSNAVCGEQGRGEAPWAPGHCGHGPHGTRTPTHRRESVIVCTHGMDVTVYTIKRMRRWCGQHVAVVARKHVHLMRWGGG
jgi:hypothetical protein